jgi:predicted glycogen debranching enzyme
VEELIRRMRRQNEDASDIATLVEREWLVTNGLGGYASGTVAGVITRRYHGFFVAALPAPLGRTMLVPQIFERCRLPEGREFRIGGHQGMGRPPVVHGADCLAEFRLDAGLPVWRYEFEGLVLEKSVLMPHLRNTVFAAYRLLEGPENVSLELRPTVVFRPHNAPLHTPAAKTIEVKASGGQVEVYAGTGSPVLRMAAHGKLPSFLSEPEQYKRVLYRVEQSRGYDFEGDLWSPGYFRLDICRERCSCLIASTESWETIDAMGADELLRLERLRRSKLLAQSHPAAQVGMARDLVLAADQFVIQPPRRTEDAARLRAVGDDVYSIIAGYHWFTDWGRDAMISLEGLTLVTGRHQEARCILGMFAHHVRDGLIPNLFPESEREGLYHTADATLWFFHALSRYVGYTGDRQTLALLLPTLREVIEHHRRGTGFGIGVDPSDGLLRQGADGYQLTWMDAKVGDWVVTPRRGKAVEINALWYNALRLMEQWIDEEEGTPAARPYAEFAEQARISFNNRFWYAEGGYLYDVVDGEAGGDCACRPNQLFSFSLEYPVLDRKYWEPVLQTVQEQLATPFGLRSLSPRHPDYKPKYYGDLRARDAAYHQGTVWAWLIGPYIDAWLRVHHGDFAGARKLVEQFQEQLDKECLGTISEIFDAEPPYEPRGCVAQAWSVAEVLRSWVKTASASTGLLNEGLKDKM